jgi:hypothetical protein
LVNFSRYVASYVCVCVCVFRLSLVFLCRFFFFLYIIITVGSFVVVVCAQVIETQKERAAQFDDESDLIDAYVACGGNADKSGCVSADMLIKIIKHDFGLTIDIEELIRAIDTDGSGEVSLQNPFLTLSEIFMFDSEYYVSRIHDI